MKVAVVTPYYKESLETLRRCHDSVINQGHKDVEHIMLSDGAPQSAVDDWNVTHIRLPGHNDSGNTPRAIGGLSAAARGADAMVLLDADNWFELDHLEALIAVHQYSEAPIVTCARWLCREDGSRLGICRESDGVKFNDTNCYFFTRPTFYLMGAWGYKNAEYGHYGDRAFWQAVQKSGLRRAHSHKPTVNYWTTYASHYRAYGEDIPEGSKVLIMREGEKRPTILDAKELPDANRPET